VCEPECPPEAIVPDTEPGVERWLELNREYSAIWPNITRKGEPPADADDYKDVPNKFEKYFSPKPGTPLRPAGLCRSGCTDPKFLLYS